MAYCLRITDLDPIRYDLLFERFLNPSRISMPDIDMDFDSRYRDEMIRYAAERYGRDHVAQIVTFSTIKARAAVRDAARVLGYPYARRRQGGQGHAAAGHGPRHAAAGLPRPEHEKYADGYKMAAELRDMYATDPDAKEVIDVAKGLEGLRRQDGIHAAAVVITKRAAHRVPAHPAQARGRAATPRTRRSSPSTRCAGSKTLGLLKMDFLGLRNLDVITDTVELIERDPRHRPSTSTTCRSTTGRPTSCCSGATRSGVFQLEGRADAGAHAAGWRPPTFEDVAALVALYRPGPMAVNMHNDYADRKNGRKPVDVLPPRRRGGARPTPTG